MNGPELLLPTVLIVDDTAFALRLLAEGLQDEYSVKTASSGQQALAIAQAEPQPDAILWDPLESTCRHASLSIL